MGEPFFTIKPSWEFGVNLIKMRNYLQSASESEKGTKHGKSIQ